MSRRSTIIIALTISFFAISCCRHKTITDIMVAGGGTSGIAAGIQSARLGINTTIIEEGQWLGGMLSSAGVSAVDGNYKLQGGIWKEFKDSLSVYYGGDSLLKTGWVSNVLFEPSVGSRIFSNMVKSEKNLSVVYDSYIESLRKKRKGWIINVRNTKTNRLTIYDVKCLIDATELGDIAKLCGVKYDIGMDASSDTGEDIAPDKSNNIIQDLTYVAILKDYGREVPIKRPEDYDSTLFACSCINPHCVKPDTKSRLWPKESMINYGKLPGKKYMINWPIYGNDYYVNIIEMNREDRFKALIPAKRRTLSFIYFIQNELGYKNLSLADDEFPTSDNLPFIPYHRESRRIHGKVRFTLNHITHPYDQVEKLYRTCIGVGDYPIDHHHSRYSGADTLPDLHFYPVPSYGLPLGVLIPESTEDLIVAEKSVSVTNIVNGSTRLQPVVLQIGQAAGALAALSVMHGIRASEVPVREVQRILLDAGGYLLPYLDIAIGHPWFKPIQRIGSTGIMKGIGMNSGWSNQTFFRAYDPVLTSELFNGLKDIYQFEDPEIIRDTLSVKQGLELIKKIARENNVPVEKQIPDSLLGQYGIFCMADSDRHLLRGEMAVILDLMLDPFNKINVDIKGNFINNKNTKGNF